MIYLIVKSLHIVSVIAWMAGLLYLPRLFVYHVENADKKSNVDMLVIMERRLLKYIMTPAMVASLGFGILLFALIGFTEVLTIWGMVKVVCIAGLVVVHFRLAAHRQALEQGQNTRTSKYFRLVNEVPTVLMIIIVFAVIVKPGT